MVEYGIQLYSLRDISATDLEGTLKTVAEIGYKTVEFAGFFGHPAETVKEWLDRYGLKAVGTHTNLKELGNDLRAVIDYHKVIGCKNIIIPSAPHKTREDVEVVAERINSYLPEIEEAGLFLHYHNHDYEFLSTADGVIPFEILRDKTGVLFEIDTYWAYVAGKDPCALLDECGDRVKMIHLKDGFADRRGVSLGLGTAPVNKVLNKAIATGRTVVVESEGLDPTGAEEVARCMEYLKSI